MWVVGARDCVMVECIAQRKMIQLSAMQRRSFFKHLKKTYNYYGIYRAKVTIPATISDPTNAAEKYQLFQTTPNHLKFEQKYPHYRA